jgi:hypothetical protein
MPSMRPEAINAILVSPAYPDCQEHWEKLRPYVLFHGFIVIVTTL